MKFSYPTLWLCCSVILLHFALGLLETLPRDGPVSGLTGYPGLTYQAVRFEPICGSLGNDASYNAAFVFGSRCNPAAEAFGNDTTSTLAFYDVTGTQLTGAIVGNGVPLCMCFALGRSDGRMGNLCVYANERAQMGILWNLIYDNVAESNYQVSGKAMGSCVGADLASLKAKWSATAANPSRPASTRDVSGISTVFTSTITSLSTGTNSAGSLTTFSMKTTATIIPTATSSGGLSQSDKIALGVGIGIGIPTFIVGLLALCMFRRRA